MADSQPAKAPETERQPVIAQDDMAKEDVKKKENAPINTVSYWSLYRYATTGEKYLVALAFIMSAGQGALMPVFSLIFGDMTSDFGEDKSPEQRRSLASKTALNMFYVGLGTLGSALIATMAWSYVGNRINTRVRKMYFEAVIGQEMGWFDVENASKMTTAYIENLHKFENAVGRKNHVLIMSLSMTLAGFIIGFYKGWWYSLIVTLSFPIVMIGMIGFLIVMQKESAFTKQNYERAGAYSEQALLASKTVRSLNGEAHELSLYAQCIETAKNASIRFGFLSGFSYGVFYAAVFISYGLNYWIGSVLVDRQVYNGNEKRDYNVSDVVTIFFSVITGAFAIGNTSPASKALAMGQEAAYAIYQLLDRKSKIPLNDPNGYIPQDIEGDIEFRDVGFSYPSRTETKVLNGLNLKIPKGKKVALVGETGCGKSTTIQLVERYYDPSEGQVLIDGRDIKDYNLVSLRRFIGYVGQEPVLFAMSVRENLLMAKPSATEAEIVDALKKANAWVFVQKLENKLDTYVGAGGSQLSGGQKQRIAIARSILQNPKILLLDEATSALDRRNERQIQETLDNFASQRTTLTIAHRLSTIINSDLIYVFSKGKVVESGNHQQLMAMNGVYTKLVTIQLHGTAAQTQSEIPDPDAPALDLGEKKVSVDPQIDNEPEDQAAEVEEIVVKSTELTPEERKKFEAEEQKKAKEAAKRLTKYLEGNYGILIMGCIFAAAVGALMPVFAIFLAKMITILSKFQILLFLGKSRDDKEWEDNKNEALYIGMWFLIMAVIALVTNFFQLGLFNMLAQKISSRIRQDLYSHFLTREQEFFDDVKNNPGELSSILAKDCLTVNTVVSTSYGAQINGMGAFVGGIIIAMIASWRLALVSLSVSPVIVIAGVLESSQHAKEGGDSENSRESKMFQEVCTNMKTVNSLNAAIHLRDRFFEVIEKEVVISITKVSINSVIYAVGQFGMFAVYALTFYAGSEFVTKYGLRFEDLFTALFAIIFAAFGAGMSQQFAGNVGEAQMAAKKIFEYLDVQNKVQPPAAPVTSPIKGHIEFRNVKFTYPQRKTPCFTDLSFKIEPNQKIAFAGPSGTGKSTIFSLLFRFYDVDSGEILIDGVNIKNYDIAHLRAALGMVSQEPVLFNNTIKYNIKYNQQSLTDEQMREATAIANATKFIENDETEGGQATEDDGKGYERKVGLKGGKLSGGQKQRVAIARTVIRRPNVYMFDESTSALDTDSERVVQEALNNISANNTTLSIAHRIATIRDCDVIFVIEKGRVAEQGNFNQLMSSKGVFYQLNKDM